MRLDPRFLMGAVLAAAPMLYGQQPGVPRPGLPWAQVLPLAWQAEPLVPGGLPSGLPEASTGPLALHLEADGTLRVSDARGLVRLHTGLPGRPLRAWRDGGVPLTAASGRWSFPTDSPLAGGLGALGWGAEDFRPFLRGLCWVLEDGESFLSVIHPATAQIIHLPLPPGRDLSLRFLADRLEVSAGDVDKGAPRQWSLPWIGLLPRLAALGPRPDPGRSGTALVPFPRE